jgi:two-component system response regulator (stage 0 sporulation protein F)
MQLPQPDAPRPTPHSPPCVLIVEDDEGVRDVLEMLFADDGFEVVACAGIEKARDTLRACQPQLLVSDMRLGNAPRGGLELVRAARAQVQPPPPAIVLTGMQLSAIPREVRALEAAGAQLVSKPFDIEALLRVARSLTAWPGKPLT